MNTEIFELTEERITKLKRIAGLLVEIHDIWATEEFEGVGKGSIPVFDELESTIPGGTAGLLLRRWYAQAPFTVAFLNTGDTVLLRAYMDEAREKKCIGK
jgi:hypothetical protein